MNKQHSMKKSSFIKNSLERKLVIIALFFALLWIIGSVYATASIPFSPYEYENELLEETIEVLGTLGMFGFFFAVLLYPSLRLIKMKKSPIRSFVQPIFKYVRLWHVPIAITTIGITFVHGWIALKEQFVFDDERFTGTIAFSLLFLLGLTGMLRYKRLDKKMHLLIGGLFSIVFAIHVLFS
ncbi:hypothetical protein H1Z61_00110 [Bacillus aquiflavi]|uniref:Uncharacterized protein n=1 Tax=Bacillus aquiflavi TaxID=2672567 RepID=A0A6B3VUG1_9BACI|nr:hypothetical protein [Bacillus aquiflavi]MBA4535571.1 hypothetical protein [Bacillus aquiflavi]NEY79947.1 hypothetical protein [Bacillus aquiflavi]UAC48890.1 hypothetical protein K6959_02940 [Bacillus aquiflavi]